MMRTFVGVSFLALLATWAYLVVKVMPRGSGHGLMPSPQSHEFTGRVPVWLSAELNGMDLMQTLHYIGVINPGELARILEEEDPLKVGVESPARFQCPALEAERFSSPDRRDHKKEEKFKAGQGFIYYQHLRKAGGTGFCEMATRNMKAREVPKYHCMPDNKGALATPPWSNEEFFVGKMQQHGYRIAANEWDAFPEKHLSLPDTVYATTFRHPVDRWYSQYRFEHVEHRDGSSKERPSAPFDVWYSRIKSLIMGDNYYVKTFSGIPNPPDEQLMKDLNKFGKVKHEVDLAWSYHKFNSWGSKVSWNSFERAIEVLQQFNLILVLDFVDDEMWALEEALGWTQARKQVLPHERQAVRENKKSIPAREALSKEVWSETVKSNVFDLLLFHWAKRMYLERSACRAFDQEAIANLPPKQTIAEAAHDA